MPKPGEVVDPATYRRDYESRTHRTGVPFWPDAAQRDMIFCGLALIMVVGLAAFYGPFGPNGNPDPTVIDANPRPDSAFLWIFAALALLPAQVETFLLLAAPPVIVLGLLAVPLISNRGERAPTRRPVSVLVMLVICTALAALTWLGVTSPWSPVMDAWTSVPTPVRLVERLTPLQMQGALVMQNQQCRNCHALDGTGGQRGPDLGDVGSRLSWDQLVRQVQQGGGNMPAYGKTLSAAETVAVVAFLQACRTDGQPPSSIPGALQRSASPDLPPVASPVAAPAAAP
jgi:ubiquinol-cytochrome c reductase cytochrome b subunit